MESFQHKVLDVPMPDENFDPNFTPENGTQYLQQVLYERNHCPEVVVKPFVNRNQNQQLSWNTLLQPDFEDTSTQLHPSKDWKEMQINEFLTTRQRICSMRELFQLNTPNDLPALPPIHETVPWFEYCKKNSPILRIMLQMDQRMLEVLLDHQLMWLSDAGITESWLGAWIYSTLSCLHLPLEPNTHSVLRQLAKCCVTARNRLNVDDTDEATPLNLIICIVSHCFDQTDFKSMI